MKGRPSGTKNKVCHIWTGEEKEYLKKITPGHHYKEICELMNKKFNIEFTLNQIKGAVSRYKLNTGFSGCFEKGSIPFNKGMKGICAKGCEKTWFKKGQEPINHRPLGSERITVDGYTEVKVEEPNKWKLKHRLMWEKENGAISKGYAVVFGDGNTKNFNSDNLILVSRKQLLMLNRNKLIQNDSNLTRTGIVIADVLIKMGERKKGGNI